LRTSFERLEKRVRPIRVCDHRHELSDVCHGLPAEKPPLEVGRPNPVLCSKHRGQPFSRARHELCEPFKRWALLASSQAFSRLRASGPGPTAETNSCHPLQGSSGFGTASAYEPPEGHAHSLEQKQNKANSQQTDISNYWHLYSPLVLAPSSGACPVYWCLPSLVVPVQSIGTCPI
jgi:hypothetical protein